MPCIRAALIVLAICLHGAAAAAPAPADGGEYQPVDLGLCKRPPKSPPPLARESYRTYNIQRRYLDLDQDGTCEVMDVWIERLGEDPSPGMRSLEHSYFKFNSGKWRAFSSDLKFYPLAVRSATTGAVVYAEAPTVKDVGDDMSLGADEVRLLVPSGWQKTGPGTLDTLLLLPFEGQADAILRALPASLKKRYDAAH